MRRFSLNSNGFTAVEFLLIILILVIVAVAGFLVAKHVDKMNTPIVSTTTKSNNQSASWKMFCSSFGGLCLKYPSNWILQTSPESVVNSLTDKANPTPGTTEANIISPSGTVLVQYQPYCPQPFGGPATDWSDNIISITSPSISSDFKIIKATTTSNSYVSNTDRTTSPEYFLTSSSSVQSYGFTIGSHSNTSNGGNKAEITDADYFYNPKSIYANNTQCLNVDAITKGSVTSSANFSSAADAQAWFSNSEVQIAGQILDSIIYKP